MEELKKKINIILLTIIIHLIAIIIMLFLNINVTAIKEKPNVYIELEFLKEQSKELEKELEENKEFDIEEYIANLKNTGMANGLNQKFYAQNNSENLSELDLKTKYESDFLKEKYGDNYPKFENDDKNEETQQDNNSKQNRLKQNNKNTGHSGPALVFVELENKNRGKIYIEVPVFTCMNEGKVVINISINSSGSVVSTSIADVSPENVENSCIVEAAKKAANNSKFTSIVGSKTEKGKIIYSFIKQ